MENEKAIEIFNKWMDCKDAYQADPSCDGNCFSCEYYASAEEEKEAMLLAISALEKQEQDRWIPVTERLPEDYEHVLVSGEKVVKQAQFIKGMFEMEDGEGYATINGDNIEEPHFYTFKAIAWKPLPEPYTEKKHDFDKN